MTYKSLAKEKRASRDALIPREYLASKDKLPGNQVLDVRDAATQIGILTPREIEITRQEDVWLILQKLEKSEWSAQETLEAYIKSAVIAHQLVNPLTEILFDDARAQAKELDSFLEKTGKRVGPLHGLPISIKEQFAVNGYDTTIGYVSYIGKKAEKDSVLVEILKKAGAVPFVRTNCPQTMMIGQTKNEIFGETLNPHNRSLTSGGSSGGEGALIAMHGSPLGVGTDIGGSVRIPSNYNGLYGLRPSSNRFPYSGAVNTMEGQEIIQSVLGPLSRTLSGLQAFTEAILDSKPWESDPLVPRMPWSEKFWDETPEKLCLAIMWDDGVCRPDPPFKRALEEVKESLEKAGHEVVDWKMPFDQMEIQNLLPKIFGADSGKDVDVALKASGEPLLEGVIIGTENEKYSVYDSWQLAKERTSIQKRYLDHWNAARSPSDRPIDAIICPGGATTAHPPTFHPYIGYTSKWNLLDYTVATFPVTKVSETDIECRTGEPLSPFEKDLIENYSTKTFENAPVGLQLVGRRYQEEKVLKMLSKVVDARRAQGQKV